MEKISKIVNIFRFLLISVIAAPPYAISAVKTITSGTTFVFGMPRNGGFPGTSNPYLLVGNPDSARPATGILVFPSASRNNSELEFRVPAGGTIKIDIPKSLEMDTNVTDTALVEPKGLRIVATLPISVHACSEYTGDGSSYSFLVLPTSQLGVKYLTVTGETVTSTGATDSNLFNQFHVVVREDDTEVIWPAQHILYECARHADIGFPGGPKWNGNFDKPIGVISGSRCGLFGPSGCDAFVEMLPPIQSWGTIFPLVKLAGETNLNQYKIVAAKDGTIVGLGSSQLAKLEANEFRLINASDNQVSYLTANHPLLVVQIGTHLRNFDYGDPLFITVPSIDNYPMGPLTFQTPTFHPANNTAYVNFVNIVVSVGDRNCLQLDGQGIAEANTWFPVPSQPYVAASIPISAGSHQLTCTDGKNASFYVSVYGYSYYTAYGYNVALKYDEISPEPNACNDKVSTDDLSLADGTRADVCGVFGDCLATSSTTFKCICKDQSVTGPFCNKVSAASRISQRCAMFETDETKSEQIPTQCSNGGACLPDNISCRSLSSNCKNPVGWCNPVALVKSVIDAAECSNTETKTMATAAKTETTMSPPKVVRAMNSLALLSRQRDDPT